VTKPRRLWPSLWIAAVISCIPPAVFVQAVAATDEQPGRPDIGRKEADSEIEQAPRVERNSAELYFEQFVFGGDRAAFVTAARNQLDGILRQKVAAIDLICGLTGDQKEKLQLAARGDVSRLFDRIDKRQREIRLLNDVEARARLGEHRSRMRVCCI
jgi:hypothetical protein